MKRPLDGRAAPRPAEPARPGKPKRELAPKPPKVKKVKPARPAVGSPIEPMPARPVSAPTAPRPLPHRVSSAPSQQDRAANKAARKADRKADRKAAKASTKAPKGKNPEALEARRKLREAVRARKAYERDEVRRFTAHLRRRRRMWFIISGSAVALLIFVGIGAFSPLMAVDTITVVGASRVDANKIVAQLQSQVGKPLPLVDYGEVRKVLQEQILIESFTAEAQPPHTLMLRLVERTPVGYLLQKKEYVLVDAAGVVIERGAERTQPYPVIDVKDASAKSPGFSAAIEVMQSLPASLAGQVDRIAASTTDDVTLILGNGARIVWGGPENGDLKARVLSSLMAIHPVGSVSEYNVSSPGSASVR